MSVVLCCAITTCVFGVDEYRHDISKDRLYNIFRLAVCIRRRKKAGWYGHTCQLALKLCPLRGIIFTEPQVSGLASPCFVRRRLFDCVSRGIDEKYHESH